MQRSRRAILALLALLALASVAETIAVVARRHVRESEKPVRHLRSSSSSMEPALMWLARHQSPDGSWGGDLAPICSSCDGGSRNESCVRLTAECLLAYLGAGCSPQNRASYVDPVTGKTIRFGEVVRKGLKFLLTAQREDGSFPAGEDPGVEQALAVNALSEAFGITNAVAFRAPAQRAILHLEASRHPGAGWARRRDGPDDLEATAEALMAEKNAQISGLQVAPLALTEGLRALEKIEATGRWSAHPTGQAMDLVSRIFVVNVTKDPAYPVLARAVLADLPTWDPETNDYDHWNWAALALFQLDGPGGPAWTTWKESLHPMLANHQNGADKGCQDGSWDPCGAGGPSWERSGGRVHATATNMLTLEIFYRYTSPAGSK